MRFLRLTMMLCLLMTSIVGGAVLYARTRSSPGELQALGFGICGGRPCFMGITPGVTSWQDAREVLEKNGGQQLSMDGTYATYSIGNVRVDVNYLDNTDSVYALFVMGEHGTSLQATARDTLSYLGLPCAFYLDVESTPQLSLTYPHIFLMASLADPRISPVTPINYIGIQAGRAYCNVSVPWLGFTKSSRYLELSFFAAP